MIYSAQSFSDDTGMSVKTAKRVLDLLDAKDLTPEDLNTVIWRLRDFVIKTNMQKLMDDLDDAEIEATINEMVMQRAMWKTACPSEVCYAETPDAFKKALVKADAAKPVKGKKKKGKVPPVAATPFTQPESAWFFTAFDEHKGDYKAGDIVTIQIFRTGKWEHPGYGTVEITKDTIKDVVSNFKDRKRGIELCVDENHEPDHKALGWFRDVFSEDNDKKCFAKIELTAKGAQLLNDGAYKYFSPEIVFHKVDEESGDEQSNLLIGGAFTNRPFFKGMQSLMASEGSANAGQQSGSSRTIASAYFFSHSSMNKFLALLDRLVDKTSITASEKSELEQVYSEMPQSDRSDEINAALQEQLAKFDEEGAPPAPEAKPEGEKPDGESDEGGDEDDTDGDEATAEKPEGVDGVKANEDGTFEITDPSKFSESIKAMNKVAADLTRQQTFAECEKSVAPLVFSEKRKSRVVLPAQKKKVVAFAASLSKEQRATFFTLLGELKAVPASELGHSKEMSEPDFNKPETYSESDDHVQFCMKTLGQDLPTAQKSAAHFYAEKAKRQ